MTEIGLITTVNLVGLVFAIVLARWVASIDAGSPELRRVDSAVKRATDVQLWRTFRGAAPVAGVGLAIVMAGQVLGLDRGGAPVRPVDVLLTVLAYLLGSLVAGASATFAAQLARAAAVRSISVAKQATHPALTVLLRATGASALFCSTTTVLASVATFGLTFAAQGGFSGGADARSVAASATLRLAAFAFGAGVTALVVQRTGVVFKSSATLAAYLAAEAAGGPASDDPRNPALIAELVGSHVGRAAARILDFQVAVAAAAAVFGPLAAVLYAATGSIGVALLPLVAHAFTALATAIGLLVFRVGRQESPHLAFLRSQAATTLVALGSLAGAAVWLVGSPWRWIVAAALPASIAVLALPHLSASRLRARFGTARDITSAQRAGAIPGLTASIGAGLESALLPIVVSTVGLVLTWRIGVVSEIPSGGIVALAVSAALLMCAAPYVLALSVLDPISNDVSAVLALTPDHASEPMTARVKEIDEAGFVAGQIAQPYLSLLGTMVALGATWILGVAGSDPLVPDTFRAGAVEPEVVWGALVGGAVVLTIVGSAMRSAARGAVLLEAEIDRQLRRFPREHGIAIIPTGFAPSYRACVDLAAEAAAKGRLSIAVPLVAPWLVALVCRGSLDAALSTQALASMLLVATATGLFVALASVGASAALLGSRHATRRSGVAETESTLLRALGETIATAVGPTGLLLTKVIAAGALTLAPPFS